jgi:type IV pilus assembly protein PilE
MRPLRRRVPAKKTAGFTLIEVMIAVAVVAILATVAFPSYREYIQRSHRSEAQAHLMALAARQQQFLVDTRGYAASLATLGISEPANVTKAYAVTMTLDGGPPPGYTITATPNASQTSERCGTLTINQAGTKTAAVAGCW